MRHIIKMFLLIFHINVTIQANQTIFYIKKIPVLGKKIPDRLYKDGDLKLVATVVAAIITVFRRFAGKAFYLGLFIALPVMFLLKSETQKLQLEYFVQTFVFFSVIAGTILSTSLFESNLMKYICIKLMRFNAKDYLVPSMFAKHLGNLFFIIPSLCIIFLVLGASPIDGVLLTVSFTMIRFIFEGLCLLLYEKTKIVFADKHVVMIIIGILGIAAGYALLYFRINLFEWERIYTIQTNLFLLIFSAISLFYIMKYKHFKKAAYEILKNDDISANADKMNGEIIFGRVKINEKDFTEENLRKSLNTKKEGYDFLNSVFFQRHRKLFEKPIYIRLAVIGVVLVAALILLYIFPNTEGLENGILVFMPSFVFIMYFASIGDNACKAMFYNCDISLLRYAFYRRSDVILKNFKVRLKKLINMNLIIGVAVIIALLIIATYGDIVFGIYEALLFGVCILCLAVFFSVHHLFLYYVFQPYTTSLGMKNPFFKLINGVVYFACFICLQLKNVNGYFTVGVITATVLYIGIALILVYRYAPKTFRVK